MGQAGVVLCQPVWAGPRALTGWGQAKGKEAGLLAWSLGSCVPRNGKGLERG